MTKPFSHPWPTTAVLALGLAAAISAGAASAQQFASFADSEADFAGPPRVPVRPPATTPDVPEDLDAADAPNADNLSVSLYIDATNSYFWRGIRQNTDSLHLQPGLEIGANLFEAGSVSFSGVTGIWNSFQEPDGANGDGIAANHYELDYYAGLTAEFDKLALTATYQVYSSPNDAFAQVDELRFDAAYNDEGLIAEGFALNPYATIAFELKGAASGSDEGVFVGLGVAPTVLQTATPIGDMTLETPVALGFSLDNYYQDNMDNSDAFGFIDVGADASFDLAQPNGYGDWSCSAGLHALFLGDAASNINRGTEAELVFRVGFAIDF